jgi:hypothetical protein
MRAAWKAIDELNRDLRMGEPVKIRCGPGSTNPSKYDGYSGLAVGNLDGARPRIELHSDAEGGRPLLVNIEKRYIHVNVENP